MANDVRHYEDIQIGDEITPLVKEIGIARMMAYGAATWDFIRLHYDADYARELGFEAIGIGTVPNNGTARLAIPIPLSAQLPRATTLRIQFLAVSNGGWISSNGVGLRFQ